MAILFYSQFDDPNPWRHALVRELPDIAFRVWPDVGDAAEIRYALVWKPPSGLLKTLPNLRAILSLGAGVDGILRDPELPRTVPLVRLVDAGLAQQMSEYALYGVLHFHRDMHRYAEQQRASQWRALAPVAAEERSVGVMGLGVLGSDFVAKLEPLGFRVLGFSRTPRAVPGVTVFHGDRGLRSFLAESEILVNFLPLTPQTERILNAQTLAWLPRGACIVNIARGGHVDEDALLAALDAGQIGGALLDVYDREPLPAAHRFWRHPRVFVTPHIAAQAIAELAVSQVIENIRRIERGDEPVGRVEVERGY
jgi:glyoxylate/hydroxypyruvate reductase A